MIVNGKAGDWYEDDNIGGFIRADGTINICVEKILSDADMDAYSIEVQNGDGYYDDLGVYRSYMKEMEL